MKNLYDKYLIYELSDEDIVAEICKRKLFGSAAAFPNRSLLIR